MLTAGERLARAADRLQRRQPWLAFPVAVGKKFSDDRAHSLAALVAYFAFVSILPLLLVLATVLDIILRGDAALRHRLLASALGSFPVIGPELRGSAHPLRETGIALVIGLAAALLGGSRVAAAAQNALNSAWLVPYTGRPRFPRNQLRNLAFVVVVGLGLIASSVLSGAVGGAGHVLTGAGARIGASTVALALNIVVFWTGFRLVTASMVTARELRLGALAAAVAWQALQLLGGFFAAHILARSSALYGTFGIVLGLLAWLYLQAQITMLAIEINVVRARGLWPRSLCPPPLTPQDMTAYRLYAQVEQRRRGIDIEVDRDAAGPAAADPGPEHHENEPGRCDCGVPVAAAANRGADGLPFEDGSMMRTGGGPDDRAKDRASEHRRP